ncbi:hypothetical protein [Campylobacter gastrosuis]|uniref:Uncharacterized protein n=1 Tax=Campylobacter gastrosuis TaxID=2974576 RepID=A0ABT7HN62_9BACT|nr:hypothetical protein [Campylobacter gastrosuis]MDL0088210.1 hypothetical protein [Campylobacter gastrosuis]
MSEYLDEVKKEFNEYLQKSGGDRVLFLQSLIGAMSYRIIGLDKSWTAECFSTNDYEKHLDLIYQANRFLLMPSCSGGYDHSMNTFAIFRSFYCNDLGVIERILPHELGICKNGYPFYLAFCNLFMGLWYKDEKILDYAVPKAVKFSESKKPLWERSAVRFLLGIYEKDAEILSESFKEICTLISRIDINEYDKIAAPHGFYAMALCFGFDDFTLPDCKNFSIDFAKWQRQNLGYKPKLYFKFQGELELLNTILTHDVAKSIIRKPYENDKKFYLDEDEMAKNMARELDATF